MELSCKNRVGRGVRRVGRGVRRVGRGVRRVGRGVSRWVGVFSVEFRRVLVVCCVLKFGSVGIVLALRRDVVSWS